MTILNLNRLLHQTETEITCVPSRGSMRLNQFSQVTYRSADVTSAASVSTPHSVSVGPELAFRPFPHSLPRPFALRGRLATGSPAQLFHCTSVPNLCRLWQWAVIKRPLCFSNPSLIFPPHVAHSGAPKEIMKFL